MRDRPETSLRIAMWSGPRNISTALMRAWESRPDTVVCDEPFYAHYLDATGVRHPGVDEIVTHHETDWRVVVDFLLGPVPGGAPIFYQKHMAHHLLPHLQGPWLWELTHAFLIRDPRDMLLSLARIYPYAELRDTGLPQQVDLFERVRAHTGATPPVVDARDVLSDPRAILPHLCARLGVAFDERMLSWSPGLRATDGIWAKHWYGQVERSTGFAPYPSSTGELSPRSTELLEACRPLYEVLYAARLGG